MATFWGIAAHSVSWPYILSVLCRFIILFTSISCFGLKGRIWVLIEISSWFMFIQILSVLHNMASNSKVLNTFYMKLTCLTMLPAKANHALTRELVDAILA